MDLLKLPSLRGNMDTEAHRKVEESLRISLATKPMLAYISLIKQV